MTDHGADVRPRRQEVDQYPACALCGQPQRFDTSVPSVQWNAVIRAKGLPDHICLTCIVEAFVTHGESFTATLWGGPFSGRPIEVRVDGSKTDITRGGGIDVLACNGRQQ